MTRRSKYGARRTIVRGQRFDSNREAARWQELLLLERAGEIADLRRQVRYPLAAGDRPLLLRSAGYPNGRRATYVADFVYRDRAGQEVIEDAKGYRTPEYRLKRAIMEATGHEIREV